MALPNPVFIVYEVNRDLEILKPPIHGEVVSAHATAASAGAALARVVASTEAAGHGGRFGREYKTLLVSVPTVFVYDGSGNVPFTASGLAQLHKRSELPPKPLKEAAVHVLALEGDIGCGTQAIVGTRAEAEALVAKWRKQGAACDQMPGFEFTYTKVAVEV